MKTITRTQIAISVSLSGMLSMVGCASQPDPTGPAPASLDAGSVRIDSPKGTPRPPFVFQAEDEAFLDEIQKTTFFYFWEAVDPDTNMVYDRTSSDVVSVAGVGFQLAALPIGVERGWITRAQGEERARVILDALEREPSNRKHGLFYHFINPHDASARRVGRELVVSTIDSALLFSGMMVAGEYFGGGIEVRTDRLFAAADWTAFLADPGSEGPEGRFLSLGWKPTDDAQPTGDGELLPYYWIDSGDEHRLATILGICAPNPRHRVPTETYWALRRQLGWHDGQGPVVTFPFSGALFTAFFSHLFVDHGGMGLDDPAAHGQTQRARVDWWENSRRLVHLHRDAAIENPEGLPTLGPDAWGFSASDGPDGYLVSQVFPDAIAMEGATPEVDFSTYRPTTVWGGGVIAPYAPGTSIMFEPELAIDALRAARAVEGPGDEPGVWRGSHPGGWGFADAYRLGPDGRADWVAEDFVAISQGPLLIGIENARTGLIWELFGESDAVEDGYERLGE